MALGKKDGVWGASSSRVPTLAGAIQISQSEDYSVNFTKGVISEIVLPICRDRAAEGTAMAEASASAHATVSEIA